MNMTYSKLDLKQYGYYEYKGNIYYDRHQILDDMLRLRDYDGKFKFIFNDDFFDGLNWEEEPQIDILSLYKLRAQQIRQKYDYIILLFSGGADSVQILNTCLDNNIFIDEIQCYHCEKGISKIPDANNLNMVDMLEFKYSSKKYLEKVRLKSPKTKITTIDMTDYIYDEIANKKFSYLGLAKHHMMFAPMAYNTYPRIYTYLIFKHNQENHSGKSNRCFIRGMDKPVVNVRDGHLYFNFTDVTLNHARNVIIGEVPSIGTFENFYWSADAPLIPIKQSHMLLHTFKQKTLLRKYFIDIKSKIAESYRSNDIRWYSHNLTFSERVVANIVYPGWFESKTYAGMKGEKQSADFLLLNYMNIQHQGEEAIKEYRDFTLKKYDKINHKFLLSKFIPSKQYKVGKI